ncbi:MAG: hypothetical protein ACJ71N_03640 [Terriglobales bacterium]|jgi:hypothetical protein
MPQPSNFIPKDLTPEQKLDRIMDELSLMGERLTSILNALTSIQITGTKRQGRRKRVKTDNPKYTKKR